REESQPWRHGRIEQPIRREGFEKRPHLGGRILDAKLIGNQHAPQAHQGVYCGILAREIGVNHRHRCVAVVYTDFTSQYPTVNTLMGLWRMLIANELRVQDATAEVRALFKSFTPDRLFDPPMSPRLAFFA